MLWVVLRHLSLAMNPHLIQYGNIFHIRFVTVVLAGPNLGIHADSMTNEWSEF